MTHSFMDGPLALENTTHATNVAPDIVKSAGALRQARSHSATVGSSERSVSFAYKNITVGISDTPPPLDQVRYQISGTGRKPATALFLNGIGNKSSAWLAEQFGELVLFERLNTHPPTTSGSSAVGPSISVPDKTLPPLTAQSS
jgi:hypothetical protein